jgi:hypothetical protein
MKRWVEEIATSIQPKGRFSQGGQDAILSEIFRNIGTVNSPPFAVEFGFNAASLEGGSGSNVARLVLEEGWRALLLDGGYENSAINLHREFLTSGNIVDVFARHGVPAEPEYVSIDLDSTDLWIFRAILTRYRARVFSVEYNANFPLGAAITFPDDPSQHWELDRGYGASLSALSMVAREHGYSLVAVEPRRDAFFVRDDLLDDGSGTLAPPLDAWRGCTGITVHSPLARPERAAIFLDYDCWRSSGGDVAAARRAAGPVARRYLLSGLWRHRIRRVAIAVKGRLRLYLGSR